MKVGTRRSRRFVSPGLALMGCALLLGIGCTERPAPDGAPFRQASSPDTATNAAPTPPQGLDFVPPEPGTYELPPIQPATDGFVVGVDGERHRLFEHMGDRYVVLSFVYTRCPDPRGCPLARVVFYQLHRALESDPELAGRVRLVTLSFDPEHDTPEVLRSVSQTGLGSAGEDDWIFLTTASKEDLQPILDGYGQYVVPEVDETGEPTGLLSHVLKVFLIDREHRVRNVYSASYLHPEVVLNDLKSLVLEGEAGG